MVYADAWFTRGHGHRVCNDYALARAREAEAQVVLCDGCSGSPDTDLGARLLARAAMDDRLGALWTQAQAIGLPVEGLDATLLRIRADHESARVSVQGDGVVAVRRRDGALAIWRVSYPSGAPAYLAHQLGEPRLAAWRARFGEARVIHHTNFEGTTTVETRPGVAPLSWRFEWAEVDLVAVFSDGVSAFEAVVPSETSRSAALVPTGEVVEHLMRVQYPQAPRFTERRLHKFLSKTCAKRRWRPVDDVAVAMIASP